VREQVGRSASDLAPWLGGSPLYICGTKPGPKPNSDGSVLAAYRASGSRALRTGGPGGGGMSLYGFGRGHGYVAIVVGAVYVLPVVIWQTIAAPRCRVPIPNPRAKKLSCNG
jgi:hypothetical protein